MVEELLAQVLTITVIASYLTFALVTVYLFDADLILGIRDIPSLGRVCIEVRKLVPDDSWRSIWSVLQWMVLFKRGILLTAQFDVEFRRQDSIGQGSVRLWLFFAEVLSAQEAQPAVLEQPLTIVDPCFGKGDSVDPQMGQGQLVSDAFTLISQNLQVVVEIVADDRAGALDMAVDLRRFLLCEWRLVSQLLFRQAVDPLSSRSDLAEGSESLEVDSRDLQVSVNPDQSKLNDLDLALIFRQPGRLSVDDDQAISLVEQFESGELSLFLFPHFRCLLCRVYLCH